MTIGRATYQPGWKWSVHVGPELVLERCPVEHLGLVISGEATTAFADGRVIPLKAGELYNILPIPHDSWATNLTCHCTSWARITMRNNNG